MIITEIKKIQPIPFKLKGGKEMIIRLLNKNDGEAFVKLYGDINPIDNRYYIGPIGCTREKAMLRATSYDSKTEIALVIDDGNENILGEAWYRWKNKEDPISVFGIYISREIQGEGAGKVIMNALMKLSSKYGPEKMSLTVQKENERAVKLYTKLGFKIIREQMRKARPDCEELPEYYMVRKCR